MKISFYFFLFTMKCEQRRLVMASSCEKIMRKQFTIPLKTLTWNMTSIQSHISILAYVYAMFWMMYHISHAKLQCWGQTSSMLYRSSWVMDFDFRKAISIRITNCPIPRQFDKYGLNIEAYVYHPMSLSFCVKSEVDDIFGLYIIKVLICLVCNVYS